MKDNIPTELFYVLPQGETLTINTSDIGLDTPNGLGAVNHGKLALSNEFIYYTPLSNFIGQDKFLILYNNFDPITVNINVTNTFKPRARIINIIGQELISSDVIALVELIKNSYDADAENITIELNNIFSEEGEILVSDTGTGMTYEKITNVWLEPATPDKKVNSEYKYSKFYQRRLLGEKGIGRFAVHRLGDKIELITRACRESKDDLYDYETRVVIDWASFTDDKYLNDIPVSIERIEEPQIFKDRCGTTIRISSIHPWKNLKNVREAVLKIRGLETPVKPQNIVFHKSEDYVDPGVFIDFKSNNSDIIKEIKETKSLTELLETSFYKFSAIIDEKGEMSYSYDFNRPDYQDKRRSTSILIEDLKSVNTDWFEDRPLKSENSPGVFEVNFYAWDLEPGTLKIAGLADYYKNIIKPNAGVRIYRDNFRVWPYGEPDDDWLGLDLKRLNNPKDRPVSRNQVFGIVHISSDLNPFLKDQSNREGLIINEQYEQFYELVRTALSVFAKERKKDKILIDKLTNKKGADDIVTESIRNLRENVNKHNHTEYYDKDINLIESSYNEKINDVLERYMMAAAIGISYSIPIHEMKLRLTSINDVIDDLQKNPSQQDKYLRELAEYVKETEDIVKAVTSIMSRQKTQKVSLYKVAQNTEILKQTELKKYDIKYEIIGDKAIEVEAVPGLLNTVLLNLVDNAIYWLRAKKIKTRVENIDFHPKITITITKNNEHRIVLEIHDNGDGFEDPFNLITEPYYSRKVDGLGLGLFLSSEIMARFGGRLNGYNDNGAVFELIF